MQTPERRLLESSTPDEYAKALQAVLASTDQPPDNTADLHWAGPLTTKVYETVPAYPSFEASIEELLAERGLEPAAIGSFTDGMRTMLSVVMEICDSADTDSGAPQAVPGQTRTEPDAIPSMGLLEIALASIKPDEIAASFIAYTQTIQRTGPLQTIRPIPVNKSNLYQEFIGLVTAGLNVSSLGVVYPDATLAMTSPMEAYSRGFAHALTHLMNVLVFHATSEKSRDTQTLQDWLQSP